MYQDNWVNFHNQIKREILILFMRLFSSNAWGSFYYLWEMVAFFMLFMGVLWVLLLEKWNGENRLILRGAWRILILFLGSCKGVRVERIIYMKFTNQKLPTFSSSSRIHKTPCNSIFHQKFSFVHIKITSKSPSVQFYRFHKIVKGKTLRLDGNCCKKNV